MNDKEITDLIKEKALNLGFDAVGISKVEELSTEKKYLESWISKNYNGEMKYLERNQDKRANPALLMEGTKSVISVLLNYFPQEKQNKESHYIVSKYAFGTDYHSVIKAKLKLLMDFISENNPNAVMRSFTDSAPIFDKSWAIKSGLGWMGKNTLLINKKLGSFFFIGEIITNLSLKYDSESEKNYCGNCTKCIDLCPTKAIFEPYKIDARKCISYLTIESKDEIPQKYISALNKTIFGCDICQDVCPWNSKIKPQKENVFDLKKDLLQFKKEDWENLNEETFPKIFTNSPIKRTGYDRLKILIKLNA